MKIFIVDLSCNKDYSTRVLEEEPLGGTEATVVRVTDELIRQGHDVVVAQHTRLEDEGPYQTMAAFDKVKRPDIVISMRTAMAIPALCEKFPDAKPIIWLHDLSGPWLLKQVPIMQKFGVTNVCVSNFHKTQVSEQFMQVFDTTEISNIRNTMACNPVVVPELPDTEINRNKLVFFSSPHKGLDQVIKAFEALRQVNRNFELHIANPGYYDSKKVNVPNVINHGELSHDEVLKHVKEALCVFYPQNKFPETFGLVYAEANALGTPVLTPSLGAAREVLEPHHSQLIPDLSYQTIIKRVLRWYNGERPVTRLKPQFELENVIKQWENIFER